MQKFVAFYESGDLAEKAARAEGYTGEGSLADYVDVHGDPTLRASRQFSAETEAVDWLKQEVSEEKTCFGAGTIKVFQPVKRRCKYCICGGWLPVREMTVTQDGIEEDGELESPCHNG